MIYAIDRDTLLKLVRCISVLLYPKYHRTFLILKFLIMIHYRKINIRRCSFQVVPYRILAFLLQAMNDRVASNQADVSTCVVVSNNLMNSLKCLNGSWIKMRCSRISGSEEVQDSSSKLQSKYIIVQMFAISDLTDSSILISDIMFHNLKKHNFIKTSEECNVEFTCASDETNLSLNMTEYLPVTSGNAKIALIQPSCDVSSGLLSNVLKVYFKIPRYLIKDYIFCIDLKDYTQILNVTESPIAIDTLYFTVVELSETNVCDNVVRGCLVQKDETTLHQVTNQHCFFPSQVVQVINSLKFLTWNNYENYTLDICPSGLYQHHRHLLELLQPFYVRNEKLKVHPSFLLFGPQGVGKQEIVNSVALSLGVNVISVNCLQLQSTTAGGSLAKLKFLINRVKKRSPCILLLKNIEVMFKDKDGVYDERVTNTFHEEMTKLFSSEDTLKSKATPPFVIATCDTSKDTLAVPPSVVRAFLNVIKIPSPNEKERAAILNWLLKRDTISVHFDVSIEQLAAHMSGFLYSDIVAMLTNAVSNCYKRLRLSTIKIYEDELHTVLRKEDFKKSLESMFTAYADAIGAPRVPSVSWKDVGGLSALKEEILRTITIPLRHPEISGSGLRRSGLLLYGPPGTGKTLLAKAVAKECKLNFLSVKGPELLNMYVGQSEENVREVFQRARCALPCIIFFDELDSLAPNRGKNGDSGGVMDRVVSQLLAEMDGLQKSSQLFVIGATNRPDLIDPALLRPGRFDKLLYVGVSKDRNSQLSIMTALTRNFQLKDDVDLEKIVSLLPLNLTGADMYSLCSNAWMNAVKACVKEYKDGNDTYKDKVQVGSADFEVALSCIRSSVTEDDLQKFVKLHQQIAAH